jgi:antitoxin component YwqK of YwqJK toxin-antitoxin module
VPQDPQRPASVPEKAVFDRDKAEWILGAFDAEGRPCGEHVSFRIDGSKVMDCRYENGLLEGPFHRFHPNGELARQGEYRAGKMHGRLEAFASQGLTHEALRVCCVPPGAYRLETRYDDGSRVEVERFFNREGKLLLSDGSIHPDRPGEVSPDARFDESSRRWWIGKFNQQGEREGLFRWWATEGALLEERTFAGGKEHGTSRVFSNSGELKEESCFVEGKRSGPYLRHCGTEVYEDSRICVQRGAFTDDLVSGTWEFLDARGEVVSRYDFGVPLNDASASPVLAKSSRTAESWLGLARDLLAEHRTCEAICAFARAAATVKDRATFVRQLDELRPSLVADHASAVAAHFVKAAEGNIAMLVDALLRGGEPALILRSIASACPGTSRASLDFVDAAILLAPDRDHNYVTRTLIDLSLGDPASARTDTDRLSDEYGEQREFLRSYRQVLFPTFDFWPARARFDSLLTDLPEEPCQSLSKIREAIQKCATRLQMVRGLISEQVHGAPYWQVPDLSVLLPRGPAPLERRVIEIDFDDEEPVANGNHGEAETIETVQVDETLELAGLDVAGLMRRARADWSSLTWLCWSAGLDHVALPDQIAPPPNFAEAVGMAIERHWRSRDKLTTSGLRALTKGVRGFEWEGMQIDSMPTFLAEIVAQEYTDLRAVFFFLCDDRQESPWQDNLRRD